MTEPLTLHVPAEHHEKVMEIISAGGSITLEFTPREAFKPTYRVYISNEMQTGVEHDAV